MSEPAKPLPCPFCGAPAGEIVHHHAPILLPDGTTDESRSVKCSRAWHGCMGQGNIEDSAAAAIAAWNQRKGRASE